METSTLNMEAVGDKKISITTAVFNLNISQRNIPFFKNMVTDVIGKEQALFQSSISNDYPLVQYKSIKGKAALLGIGEIGVQAIECFLNHDSFQEILSIIGDKDFHANETDAFSLDISEEENHTYRLRQWVPLGLEVAERLEQEKWLLAQLNQFDLLLSGQILKFCKAIGWELTTETMKVSVLELIKRSLPSQINGNKYISFDITFRTNLNLPARIGLGSAAHLGFGTVFPLKKSKYSQ